MLSSKQPQLGQDHAIASLEARVCVINSKTCIHTTSIENKYKLSCREAEKNKKENWPLLVVSFLSLPYANFKLL